MSSTLGTPAALELGLLLLRFRKRAGMTLQELAAQTGSHHSELSRIEQAKRRLDDVLLGSILGVLAVTGDEREEALALFRAATDPNRIAAGPSKQLAVVRSYEDAADVITTWQPGLVPGPLQVRSYSEAVIRAFGRSQQAAVEGADFRMARAEKILSRGVDYTAIVGEYALRFPPCDLEVALEQNAHLQQVAGLPGITVRVIALGSKQVQARFGPFVLIENRRAGTSVVHLDQVSGSTTMTDVKYVRGYRTAAENLRDAAMSPEESSELIGQITEELERTR